LPRVRLVPRVSPLFSQVAFGSQSSGPVFGIAGQRKVSSALPWLSCPSRLACSFCSSFRRFSFGRFRGSGTARVTLTVLIHSSNRHPLGNCDSSRIETLPDYFTQLKAVSNRLLPPSSFVRVTDGARTPPEELVNSASSHQSSRFDFRGIGPTSLAQFFPSHLGLSWSCQSRFRCFSPALSHLSMFSIDHELEFFLPEKCIATLVLL